MTAVFGEADYRQFREWLLGEYGLDFGPDRRDILRARLEPTRREMGFDSWHQLLFHLKYHPSRPRETLLHHLTNNESYFLREPAQLDVLRGELVPRFQKELRSGARKRIRMLSAGCAGGEEPYTLAIVARQAGLRDPKKLVVTGLDVDRRALERGREGLYREHSFRRTPPEVRDRHFTPEGEQWRIDAQLREQVRFVEGNLIDPAAFGALPPQDVIFCRNVLIYFSSDAVQRAVRILHDTLAPGGSLFLGHSESLSRVPTRLVAERREGTVYYRRPET